MILCERCNKPFATKEDADLFEGGEGEHLCWSKPGLCDDDPVDWRGMAMQYQYAFERLKNLVHTALEAGVSVSQDESIARTEKLAAENAAWRRALAIEAKGQGKGT